MKLTHKNLGEKYNDPNFSRPIMYEKYKFWKPKKEKITIGDLKRQFALERKEAEERRLK